ncbi:MAG: valine--tRNA ligase [Spirochaetia bacterium]
MNLHQKKREITMPMSAHEMAKNYEPKDFEDRIYQQWLNAQAFSPEGQVDGPPFVMMIPPPNVTGVLHMGHGLNNSLQDILARYHRMQGRATLWMPGTDHAGIATQHVVERELQSQGTNRHTLGREKFIEKTWQVKDRHHAIIIDQLKKIGSSCDWKRERFTLDDGLSHAVRHVFVTLYERHLIYQGEYLVNWCTCCGTALADDEVEYEEETGFLYHLRYVLEDGSGEMIVATTRPETIFGDVAVAVHPEDPRYTHLIGKSLRLPLQDRCVPIIADKYVDREFGTACLKITPAHDINDYEIGQSHNLPSINILNEKGLLNDHVPEPWRGMPIRQARTHVVNALEKNCFLVKNDPHTHRVGHCYRCNTAIEPFMSKQWFVRMQPLAKKALHAWESGEIHFYPKRWENTYHHWLKNIRDWCISRQLWWGHRIPAWTCESCGKMTITMNDPNQCSHCQSDHIKQDPDVLDTWFSSWLWPFSTLGWPENTPDFKKYYPTQTLVTAYDIIFFWVARMIMAGLEFTNQVPFRDIYITPLVRDKKGRKMSKSLGNGIDPLDIVRDYGADALKFSIAYLSSQGQDLPLDHESFKLGSKFCNKIWNASRYLLMNLKDITLDEDIQFCELDHWILACLNEAVAQVEKAVSEYRFDDMAHVVYDYFWNDFCDWYIEASKLSLYSQDKKEQARALTAALEIMKESLALLHPFVPFLTEEIYQKIPGCHEKLLMLEAYPTYTTKRTHEKLIQRFAHLQQLISAIRTLRSEQQIAPEKRIKLLLEFDKHCVDKEFITAYFPLIASLVRSEKIIPYDPKENLGQIISCHSEHCTAHIAIADLIDKAAEKAKTLKEIEKMDTLLHSTQGKLANENFLAKAAPLAIEKERAKMQEAMQSLKKLNAYLQSLEG